MKEDHQQRLSLEIIWHVKGEEKGQLGMDTARGRVTEMKSNRRSGTGSVGL